MTTCGCWSCTHPTQDNAGMRALHTMRHVAFGEYLAARAPFIEPTPRHIVELTAGEMHVAGRCVRPSDTGLPAHPVHRA